MSTDVRCPACKEPINLVTFHCPCGASAEFVCENCGRCVPCGEVKRGYTCPEDRIPMTERGKVPDHVMNAAKEAVGLGPDQAPLTGKYLEQAAKPTGKCQCGVCWDDHPYDRTSKGGKSCSFYLLPLVTGAPPSRA